MADNRRKAGNPNESGNDKLDAHCKGMIVAAHSAAADAGIQVLARGGSAVDAAVTVATVLGVVDPANCGIGGYGGCMVIHRSESQGATQVDFNTRVPANFEADTLLNAGRSGRFVHGGPSVSLPGVVAGLSAAHAGFGRLDFSELLEPAIRYAKGGFVVGKDLQQNLAWAALRHQGLSPEFKSIFFSGGNPLAAGERLVQPQLGESLEYVAAHGEEAFREGALADAICACIAEEGGTLSESDFKQEKFATAPAEQTRFRNAEVFGSTKATSGFGILSNALECLSERELGPNRGTQYIEETFIALQGAWNARHRHAKSLIAGARHTSHFCVADDEGTLVSLTFTHGPLWFGSGLVAPETGIVLNAGANLFACSLADDAIFPMTNLTPIILKCNDGSRHAIGSPGGIRIPAIVLQMVMDVVSYGLPLSEAIALPRVSVGSGGALEVEQSLASVVPSAMEAEQIKVREYYGPACALSLSATGNHAAARDPRFFSAVGTVTGGVVVAPHGSNTTLKAATQ